MNHSSPLSELIKTWTSPDDVPAQIARYHALQDTFHHHFKTVDQAAVYRAPGRLEVIGNHTDHQHGQVIAAAIDRDTIAIAAPNGTHQIHLISHGYDPVTLDITPLPPHPDDYFTTSGLVRGLVAGFAKAGYPIGGLDVVVDSTIPSGSGLSSSASFELLMAVIFNHVFAQDHLSPIDLAKMSQWVENTYFNKPSGLMDQCAIAVGGTVAIDFKDPKQPIVTPLSLEALGTEWTWLLIQVGHSHADLSHAYAQIVEDCRQVSAFFGKKVLREVSQDAWFSHLKELSQAVPTRAILRAKHILDENQRVELMVNALRSSSDASIISLIQASGDSSIQYLGNIIVPHADHQPLALGLALAKSVLNGCGAVRVHGGGFGGSMLVVLPNSEVTRVSTALEAVLGDGAVMTVRPGSSGAKFLIDI